MRLNVKSFALTCGLVWGFGVMAFTWWRILFEGRSDKDDTLLGHIYRGYSITPLGSLFGFAWGFFDGLKGGLVFAWLYNRLAERLPMTIRL